MECPDCASHLLMVSDNEDTWSATIAHRVSCPACNELTTLAEDARAGDLITCCGRNYHLTFEYGTFAAEEVSR